MNYIGIESKKKKKNKLLQILIIIIAATISVWLFSITNIPILSNISGLIVKASYIAYTSIEGVVTGGLDYFGDVKKLKMENIKIYEELSNAKFELLEQDALKFENSDLKKMLNIDEEYSHFNKVYAEVILKDYSNWNETFTINKGIKDGVCDGLTVISENGLVGYISKASNYSSIVSTIIDPNSAVSVEVATINELALLKGDFELKASNLLKLTDVPINSEISIGEKVYTSGIGALYKKGILVGKIKEVINGKNDIDRYAVVEPTTDFTSLRIVAVIVE